jgi:hypothetical protein
MIQDILGRLKLLRLNIVNSPDFNTYATEKSKKLIDEVLQTFIRINNKNTGSSGLDISTSDRVINSFNLNGNHSIKNRLQIINEKNNITMMIKISPKIGSDIKRWAIEKINSIAKL